MSDGRKLFQGYLAATATLIFWTGFSLISRLGGKSILTPYDIYALRLITAALALLPFAASMPAQAWRDKRLWILTALCSLLYCPLVYTGFKFAPASHGAILLSGLQPLLISVVAWLVAGTRPNRIRQLGLFSISIGIVCAAMPYFSEWSPDSVLGDLLILTGSILWASYGVFAARWGYTAWTLTRAVVFGSAIIYLPIYAFFLPKQIMAAELSMIITQSVFQGLCATIFAMLTFLKAITLLGAERTAAFLALVPIMTGIIAVPLLDEALTAWLLSGLVFVSLGSYVASRYSTNPVRS